MLMRANKPQVDNFYKKSKMKKNTSEINNSMSNNYMTCGESRSKIGNKRGSVLFSPDVKPDLNTQKYSTNEKKRKSSKKRAKKSGHASLVRNKDYKRTDENDMSEPFLFTERGHDRAQSPIAKKKRNEGGSDIKTIEIDVANDMSPPWFSLKAIETQFRSSQSLMREAMKNYFVFLEFLKKIEDFSQKEYTQDINLLLASNERLFFKELQGVKGLNMDIDGLQKQIQEFDFMLSNISDLSNAESAQIQHEWNSDIGSIPSLKLGPINSDELQACKMQITHYEQKIARLENDLKREKEIKQVKYYRTDKKTNEIKRLTKENVELIDR